MARIPKKRNGLPILEGEKLRLGRTKGDGIVEPGKTYVPADQEVHPTQLVRVHPAEEVLRARQREDMERYVQDYIKFLNKVEIDCDVVSEARKIAETRGLFNKRNMFITNQEETAFGIIKFGKRPVREGVRMFVFHNDSPCLKVKPTPLLFEWDPDIRDLHLGLRVDTIPYGSPHLHQFEGSSVRVKGYVYPARTQRKKNLCFEAFLASVSQHIDDRETSETEFSEAHPGELLDLVTGDDSKQEFLQRLKIEADDLASSRLYVIPFTRAYALPKHYVISYGQDARIGAFAAMRTVHGVRRPEYTTILIGFDKEEVGSGGTGGAKGKFLEEIISAAIRESMRLKKGEVTSGIREEIFSKSYAINCDVDVGSTDRDYNRGIIKESIGKLGYGVFILGQDGEWEGDQVSTRLIARIRNLAIRNNIVSQTIGQPISTDEGEVPTFGEYLTNKGIETLCVSSVVGCLHSKEEVSHKADLYQTIRLYGSIMRDKRPFDSGLNITRG